MDVSPTSKSIEGKQAQVEKKRKGRVHIIRGLWWNNVQSHSGSDGIGEGPTWNDDQP